MAYTIEERGNFTQLERLVYDLLQVIGSSGGGSGSGAPGFNMNLLLDCCENNNTSIQDLVSQSLGVNTRLDTLILNNGNQLGDIGVFVGQNSDKIEFHGTSNNDSLNNILQNIEHNGLFLSETVDKLTAQNLLLIDIKGALDGIRKRGVYLAESFSESQPDDLTVARFLNMIEPNGAFHQNAAGNQKQVENVEVVYFGGSYMFKILYSYT
jgi:hypothetical protein